MNRIIETDVCKTVRDLAKANPCSDEGYCVLCGEFGVSRLVVNGEQRPDFALHLPTCPWRRAVQLVNLDGI
jgi:hypothetical protein